ncbi:MAG: serine/threonine protein kinase [Labilithrix sp.]|nr:serine/threonine protein kinase [Labilithrix sp.]
MMNTEAPPSQGLVGGKYQLIRMIGRGGMGSVWEARHASLGTPSAIKFIEAEYADSQEARSRFDREAKAAATIQSKHAIQIYDHGVTDDGKPYIVMELLQGEPLDKRIDRLCRMSLQDTAKILQQVSRGLARAHERGIIHRDLKPENIFIVRNQDDDEEVAKVLDFGIAKMSNSPGNPGMTSSTKTGAVLGTPFYMSPEQARGLRNVDHRTDVWSLGVIAFKCVTGKLPFDGESVGDLLVKICTSPVPVPSQVVPGIPPNFDAWFMRALEREPERRFANVTELSDALAFAAGIATRSQQGAPLAQVATIGAGPGMITPHGLSTPSPHHGTGPQGYASQTPSGYGAQSAHAPTMQTPAPGAMTNSPFTSEPIPGAGSGKGKLVVGGILAGILAIAATVGVVLVLRKPPAVPDTARGADPPPAASVAAKVDDKPATGEKPDDEDKDNVAAKGDENPATEDPTPAPDATAARATAGAATTAAKTAAKPPATAKTGGKTAAPPLPPATAPTAPATTTAKKPPRDRTDPGY